MRSAFVVLLLRHFPVCLLLCTQNTPRSRLNTVIVKLRTAAQPIAAAMQRNLYQLSLAV